MWCLLEFLVDVGLCFLCVLVINYCWLATGLRLLICMVINVFVCLGMLCLFVFDTFCLTLLLEFMFVLYFVGISGALLFT